MYVKKWQIYMNRLYICIVQNCTTTFEKLGPAHPRKNVYQSPAAENILPRSITSTKEKTF
jgi:hypothetical protein